MTARDALRMPSVLERNATLAEMNRTGKARSADGEPVDIIPSGIGLNCAEALYQTVAKVKPAVAVEVGMAIGVSSLAILTAMHENGKGRLISIDPNQSTDWKGSGCHGVRQSGFAASHELIEKPSYIALPELVARGARVDFAYIDGWHTFDYVLVDFFFIDRLLSPGGVVAFNDCSYPSIHKVLLYLSSHRHYEQIDVGLGATPVRESLRTRAFRLLGPGLSFQQRRMKPILEDRYFRKLDRWEPSWSFFHEF